MTAGDALYLGRRRRRWRRVVRRSAASAKGTSKYGGGVSGGEVGRGSGPQFSVVGAGVGGGGEGEPASACACVLRGVNHAAHADANHSNATPDAGPAVLIA